MAGDFLGVGAEQLQIIAAAAVAVVRNFAGKKRVLHLGFPQHSRASEAGNAAGAFAVGTNVVVERTLAAGCKSGALVAKLAGGHVSSPCRSSFDGNWSVSPKTILLPGYILPDHNGISAAQDMQLAGREFAAVGQILGKGQLLHAACRHAADVDAPAVFDFAGAAARKRHFYALCIYIRET